MKDYKLLRIWEVIYPIGIYFVVTNVVMFVLNLMHTMTNENYMIYQIIATVIAFPFIYAFYRKEDGGKMANLPRTILFAAAAGLFGVVLNNLIGYTGLKETSQSYQEVSAAFYGSTLTLQPHLQVYGNPWNLYHNSVLRGTSLPWHRLPAFESVFGSEDGNCIIGSNIWSHAF